MINLTFKAADYHHVNLEIHEDTLIVTAEQKHKVVVKGDPNGVEPVEGIAYFTSSQGTKVGLNGVAGPKNPKVSDTKPSGEKEDQYAVPKISPLSIPTHKCDPLKNTDDYMQKPEVITTLDEINKQTSKDVSVPYNTLGTSSEQLVEITEFKEEMNKQQSTKPVNKSTDETVVNEELD
jgi:hypothetical protein